MLEKELESSILDYLNKLPGVFAFKINTTGIWDTKRKLFRRNKNKHIHKGTSDILGLKDGKFFAIEVKNKTKPTDDQKLFLDLIEKKGGKATWVKDFAQVVQFIKAL